MPDSHTQTAGQLLTPKEVMGMLQISQATLYRIIEKRIFPFYRIRRSLRFNRGDIEVYLTSMRIESASKWK